LSCVRPGRALRRPPPPPPLLLPLLCLARLFCSRALPARPRPLFRTRTHAPRARAEPYEPKRGAVPIRFFKNKACQTAFARYMCYMNFPRCDPTGASLLMCRSVCENYFKACNFPVEMARCGPAKYLGGSSVEPMFEVDDDGLPVYQRAWWPGLPFADFEPGGCTPGIPGGAAASAPSALALSLAAALALALALLPPARAAL